MRSFSLLALMLIFFSGAEDSHRYAIADEPSAKESAKSNSKPNAAPPKVKFTISKETTYITQPLKPDGNPDYVAALEEIYSRGVTKWNNAVVLLMQAFGPGIIPEKSRQRFFDKLGIVPPPDEGDYFLNQGEFLQRHTADQARASLDDQCDQAQLGPWKPEDYPAVVQWLKANEEPLQLFVDASRRPKEFFPIIIGKQEPLFACLLPHEQKLRTVATALSVRAMLLAGEGKTKEAWQDLMACHRLARLAATQPFEIDSLIGYVVEGIAVDGDVAFAHSTKLSNEELSSMRTDLEKLPTFPTLAVTLGQGERFVFLDAVVRISEEGLDSTAELFGPRRKDGFNALLHTVGSAVDWDVPLKIGNRWYDRVTEINQISKPRERQAALRTYKEDLRKLSKDAMDPKQIAWDFFASSTPKEFISPEVGNALIAVLLPSVGGSNIYRTRAELFDEMDQTALTLAMYRNDHGEYPDRLEVLLPKYLTKIPDDTFVVDGDKPIHYRREGKAYVLWSVGNNGTDDNARSADHDPAGDDRVIRPIPAEKNN